MRAGRAIVGTVSLLALGLALATPAGARRMREQPDSYSLGRNAAGEPCTASRNWRDPAVTDPFDQSWSIGCRSVAASRPLGSVRVLRAEVALAAARKTLQCGDARTVSLRGLGEVEARRCFDTALGTPTVSFVSRDDGRLVIVSASEAALGPAEEAARVIAGRAPASRDPNRPSPAEINVVALGPAPAGAPPAAAATAFDPAVALADGISLNHKGLYVQASRLLNDALSRLPAGTAAATRAELLLEAGLADSNIRFESSAADHFTDADTLLAGAGGDRIAFLQRKRDAYRALDLLNRRRYRDALAALDRLVSAPAPAGQPLEDPAVVRVLNQPRGGARDLRASVAVPETAALAQLVLDAQANWARSVALSTLGNDAGAQGAIDRAAAAYRPLLTERIDRTPVLWLGAQISRQQGRLQARRQQWGPAVASFDRALAQMRQGAVGTAGTGSEPAIAEAALERAGVIADAGGDPKRVRREYDAAIDALIDAQGAGAATLPAGVERYLDLLITEANDAPAPDTAERFFRAVQAVGEPAVARQLNQLQTVVTSDPAIGREVRDRAELERTITRLRYGIVAAAQANEPTGELDRERQAAEAQLLRIDAALGASPRYRTVDDRPATVAEVRRALKPGEGFLKIVELNRKAYGIYINAERSWVYPLALPRAQADELARQVRASIDGKLPVSLVPFKVAESYALFSLLTGPASDAVVHANALVVDPAGPLQDLPAGVLVTDRASVDAYRQTAEAAPFDFSRVQFLAKRATISTALSPRSFLVARALPPSTARQAFLGLGDHSPARADGPAVERQISVGFGCSVSYEALADLSRQLAPISKKELEIASAALGVPRAPEITGAAFSDTAIEQRTDLADFEVLHFATHGLQEGVWGCNKSPPALVTSFGDAGSDGLLSFSEIARLRLDANLVVLSACDTASGIRDEALARQSGQEEAGSTLEGLVRAFLTANSRAVLATFWPVSAGGETDRFIGAFYGAARANSIGGSLRIAQETLMADPETSHPFYWGPYFLVGDATKPMLTRGLTSGQVTGR